MTGRIPIVPQQSFEDRHGLLLHETCWKLLEAALDGPQVSLERLMEICQSLPYEDEWNGVSWGHDYGRLVEIGVGEYLWETRLEYLEDISGAYLDTLADPYDVDISSLLVSCAVLGTLVYLGEP